MSGMREIVATTLRCVAGIRPHLLGRLETQEGFDGMVDTILEEIGDTTGISESQIIDRLEKAVDRVLAA